MSGARGFGVAGTLVGLSACGIVGPSEDCGPFPDYRSSPYQLPYPVGLGYEVNQANCSGKGHSGFWKYGYDFSMPVGTVVTAAREGTVILAFGECEDGDGGCTNQVAIEHPGGVVTVYTHLTKGGALVAEGAEVAAGDTIALSGNTGYTGGWPHLHLSLHPCTVAMERNICPSVPLTFSDTDPNPEGSWRNVPTSRGSVVRDRRPARFLPIQARALKAPFEPEASRSGRGFSE